MLKQFCRGIIIVFFLLFFLTNTLLADDCDDEHYDLFVNFLNLTQGDSILIRTMEGKTVLIDTGYGDSLEKIDMALNNKDYNSHGKIDYLIGTQPSNENIGNMAKLIETTKVGTIYLSKNIFPTQSGKEIIAISMNKGLKVNEIKDGTSINLNKEISIGFLSSNDDNTFIKLTYKKISFLFIRGLKEISDQDVLKLGPSLKSNFLNISSDNNLAICDAFLKTVSPPFTIISGKSESFSYDSILKRILESRNSDIYRTDRDGWISVDTDGNRLSIFTENLFPRCDPKDQITILTSSILSGGNYNHQNVWDRDPNTAWVEGNKEDGIGEWLEFWFYRKEQIINSISIINGYSKNNETYQNNNRVKTVRITFNTGESFLYDLKDNELQKQVLKLPKPVKVGSLRISIVDVYKGTKFRDTCISEVEFN